MLNLMVVTIMFIVDGIIFSSEPLDLRAAPGSLNSDPIGWRAG